VSDFDLLVNKYNQVGQNFKRPYWAGKLGEGICIRKKNGRFPKLDAAEILGGGAITVRVREVGKNQW
jgi:hypothetical protein